MKKVRASCIAGLLLLLAAPATAQTGVAEQVWEGFYGGCAQTPGNEYLCACAATEFVSRCQAQGARTAAQLGQCIEGNQAAWLQPVTTACGGSNHLRLGGPVRAPRAEPINPRSGPPMTRPNVWAAAFEGCGRQIGRSGATHYSCACVATYAADACAPQASVPAAHVERCIRAVQPAMTRIAPSCATFGALTTGGATAPAAGTPRAGSGLARPSRVNLREICSGAADIGRSAVAFCRQVVTAIRADDTAGFSALGAGAVGMGQSEMRLMEFGLYLDQQGGIWAFMTQGVSAFSSEGPFRATMEDQSSDTFDVDMNPASSSGPGHAVTCGRVGRNWRVIAISEI